MIEVIKQLNKLLPSVKRSNFNQVELLGTPSKIIEDSAESKTYLCYTDHLGAATTDGRWIIIRVDESTTGTTDIGVYESFDYIYPIKTGSSSPLETVKAYTYKSF